MLESLCTCMTALENPAKWPQTLANWPIRLMIWSTFVLSPSFTKCGYIDVSSFKSSSDPCCVCDHQDWEGITNPPHNLAKVNTVALIVWDVFETRYGWGQGGAILLLMPLGCAVFCGLHCGTSAARCAALFFLFLLYPLFLIFPLLLAFPVCSALAGFILSLLPDCLASPFFSFCCS